MMSPWRIANTAGRGKIMLKFVVLCALLIPAGPVRGACAAEDADTSNPVALSKTIEFPERHRRPPGSFNQANRLRVIAIDGGNAVVVRSGGKGHVVKLMGVLSLKEAAEAELKRLALDRDVFLIYSPSGEYDGNGQLSAYLYRAEDGLLINLDLIARGFSTTSDRLGPLPALFLAAERKGRTLDDQRIAQAKAEAAKLAEETRVNQERDEYKRIRTATVEASLVRQKIAIRQAEESDADRPESVPSTPAPSLLSRPEQSAAVDFTPSFGRSGSSRSSGSSSSRGSGGKYSGPRQPPGQYSGGVGSSHRGGRYSNSATGNRYQSGGVQHGGRR